jgi:hypothetical protein
MRSRRNGLWNIADCGVGNAECEMREWELREGAKAEGKSRIADAGLRQFECCQSNRPQVAAFQRVVTPRPVARNAVR